MIWVVRMNPCIASICPNAALPSDTAVIGLRVGRAAR